MLQPHPHCPGRLGPDPGVARGRGCRRRQRLGNILWTAGWTNWRVSPSRGRAEIGWGQSKLGPGWPDLGKGVARKIHTHSHPKRDPVQTHKLLSPWPQRDCQPETHQQGQTQRQLSHIGQCQGRLRSKMETLANTWRHRPLRSRQVGCV